jgi:hypothetical protein
MAGDALRRPQFSPDALTEFGSARLILSGLGWADGHAGSVCTRSHHMQTQTLRRRFAAAEEQLGAHRPHHARTPLAGAARQRPLRRATGLRHPSELRELTTNAPLPATSSARPTSGLLEANGRMTAATLRGRAAARAIWPVERGGQPRSKSADGPQDCREQPALTTPRHRSPTHHRSMIPSGPLPRAPELAAACPTPGAFARRGWEFDSPRLHSGLNGPSFARAARAVTKTVRPALRDAAR